MPIPLRGMKRLRTANIAAWVDDDDFERLKLHRWRVRWTSNGLRPNVYTQVECCDVTTRKHRKRAVFLHHFVLGVRPGFVIDHINNNPLDNRKQNLRYATMRQNSLNTSPPWSHSTGYKGVTIVQGHRFAAHVWAFGKRKLLGIFDTALQAAAAYDKAAQELFGEFAYLNRGRQGRSAHLSVEMPSPNDIILPDSYSAVQVGAKLNLSVKWVLRNLDLFPHRFTVVYRGKRKGECRIPVADFDYLVRQMETWSDYWPYWPESIRDKLFESIRTREPFHPSR